MIITSKVIEVHIRPFYFMKRLRDIFIISIPSHLITILTYVLIWTTFFLVFINFHLARFAWIRMLVGGLEVCVGGKKEKFDWRELC